MFLGCFMCPSPSLPHPPPPPPSSPAPSTNQIGFLWYLVVFFLTITFVFFLQLLSSSSSSSSSSFQCLWAVDDETERVGLSSRDSLDALNLIFTFKKWTKKNWWLCIGGEAEEEEKGKEEEEEEEILLRCLTTSVDTFRSPLLSHFIEEGLIFTFVWNFSGIFWKNVVAVAVVAFFHAANIHWMRLHDDYIN